MAVATFEDIWQEKKVPSFEDLWKSKSTVLEEPEPSGIVSKPLTPVEIAEEKALEQRHMQMAFIREHPELIQQAQRKEEDQLIDDFFSKMPEPKTDYDRRLRLSNMILALEGEHKGYHRKVYLARAKRAKIKELQEQGLIPDERREYKGFWDELGRNTAGGGLNVASGMLGTLASVSEGAIWDKDKLEEWAQKLHEKSGDTAFTAAKEGGWKGFVAASVGQAFPYMAAATVSVLVTGQPYAAFGVGFSVEGDNAYRDALAAGATEEEAQMNRLVVGTINGVIEQIQVSQIFKFARVGKGSIRAISKAAQDRAMKKVLKAGGKLTLESLRHSAREALEEVLQETTSIAAEARINSEAWNNATERILRSGLGGGVVGLAFGSAGAVRTAARPAISGLRLDKKSREFKEFALSKEGSEIVAAEAPEIAAKIAAKENPSRGDLKELGVSGWNAEERKQLSSLFRDALAEREEATPQKRAQAIDYVKSVLSQEQYAALDEKAKSEIGQRMLAEQGVEVEAEELIEPLPKAVDVEAEKDLANIARWDASWLKGREKQAADHARKRGSVREVEDRIGGLLKEADLATENRRIEIEEEVELLDARAEALKKISQSGDLGAMHRTINRMGLVLPKGAGKTQAQEILMYGDVLYSKARQKGVTIEETEEGYKLAFPMKVSPAGVARTVKQYPTTAKAMEALEKFTQPAAEELAETPATVPIAEPTEAVAGRTTPEAKIAPAKPKSKGLKKKPAKPEAVEVAPEDKILTYEERIAQGFKPTGELQVSENFEGRVFLTMGVEKGRESAHPEVMEFSDEETNLWKEGEKLREEGNNKEGYKLQQQAKAKAVARYKEEAQPVAKAEPTAKPKSKGLKAKAEPTKVPKKLIEGWLPKIKTKLIEREVKNLSDAELKRAFKGTTAENRLIEYAKLMRESGDLKYEDIEALKEPAKVVGKKLEPKRVNQLRRMADTLDKQIEDKRRDMTQNPTPKRMREYYSRLHDADNLERTQKAMRAMADALEPGTLPTKLEGITKKADISSLVYKGLLGGGYYEVNVDPEYRDKSPEGKLLQRMIESAETPEQKAVAAEREKKDAIAKAEEKFRFLKIPGFFPTPKPTIETMLDRADIEEGMEVLEPSAGKGDIADSLKEAGHTPKVIEIRPALQDILQLKGYEVVGTDFLEHTKKYDRIVMNPPFEKGQDIDHVRHAYELLKSGGKLVSIMSESPFFRTEKKYQEFRDWFDEVGGESEKLTQAFKGKESFRQTGVSGRIVEIEKLKTEPAKVEKEIEYEEEAITEPAPSPEVDTGKAGKIIPTGKLDPTNPKEALEIIKLHAQFMYREEGVSVGGIFKQEYDAKTKETVITSIEYTAKQVDTAYRTIQKPVESPMPDTELFAMPGKEAQMKAIAEKMAKVKGVVKPKKKGLKALTKPTALPKAKTKKEDHIKAVYVAAEKGVGTRYAINGILVEGDNLVATDGRRMFWAKGKWGKDGIYLDAASLKKGVLGKVDKTGQKFPTWKDIVPDVSSRDAILVPSGGVSMDIDTVYREDLDTVYRRVRQAALITTEESKGITIIVNIDGSLGFAAAAPEVGHVEINIQTGGRILGAVNPTFLMDVIRFHAIRGNPQFEFYFNNFDRPILTKSIDGKTFTVTMPINVGEEGPGTEAIAKAISEGKPPAAEKPKSKGLKEKPTVEGEAKAKPKSKGLKAKEPAEKIETKYEDIDVFLTKLERTGAARTPKGIDYKIVQPDAIYKPNEYVVERIIKGDRQTIVGLRGEVFESRAQVIAWVRMDAKEKDFERAATVEEKPKSKGVKEKPDVEEEGGGVAWETAVRQALEKSKKKRRIVRVEQKKARRKRAGAYEGTVKWLMDKKGLSAKEAIEKATAVLKGPLTEYELYQGLDEFLPPETIENAYRDIATTDILRPYERISTKEAFEKLEKGVVLTPSDVKIITKWRPEFAKIANERVPLTVRIFSNVEQALGLLKFGAAFDIQMRRQARWLRARHPVLFTKVVGKNLGAYISKKYADKLAREVEDDPRHEDAIAHKVQFLERDPKRKGKRTEQYISYWGEKIPLGIGKTYAASMRGFIDGFNWLQQQLWNYKVEHWERQGVTITEEMLYDLADFNNTFLGMAKAKTTFGRATRRVLAPVMWSPTLTWSRIRTPSMILTNKTMRIETAVSLAGYIGSGMLFMLAASFLARALDKEDPIEWDPRATDFGKIRIGDTRIDVYGDGGPYIRALVQLLYPARYAKKKNQAGRLRRRPRLEVLKQFVRNKRAPFFDLLGKVWSGRTYYGGPAWEMPDWAEIKEEGGIKRMVAKVGEKVTEPEAGRIASLIAREVYLKFAPFFAQSVIEASWHDGWPVGLAAGTDEFFSGQSLSYEPSIYAKVQMLQDISAVAKYDTLWDDLSPSKQKRLRKEVDEINVLEEQLAREKLPLEEIDLREQNKVAERIRKSLPKEIRDELAPLGRRIIPGLSRRIGTDYWLNDKRYAQYEKLATSHIEKRLKRLFANIKWTGLDISQKEKAVRRIINEAKETARAELLKLL